MFSLQNKSMNISNILDKILKGSLAVLFVFGCTQFLVVATITLFGIYFDWQQYVSSLVLAVIGLFSVKILVKVIPDDGEES